MQPHKITMVQTLHQLHNAWAHNLHRTFRNKCSAAVGRCEEHLTSDEAIM